MQKEGQPDFLHGSSLWAEPSLAMLNNSLLELFLLF